MLSRDIYSKTFVFNKCKAYPMDLDQVILHRLDILQFTMLHDQMARKPGAAILEHSITSSCAAMVGKQFFSMIKDNR